jgi:cytochrome P450
MVDGLLNDIEERGSFDVVADLAHPLPVAVICRLLGVPLEVESKFSHASALLAQALDPFTTFTDDLPDGFDERMAARLWLWEYLHGLIDQRRAESRDDLISGLIAAEEGGDQLTEDEIIATCNLLLVAGHETR